MVLSSDKDDEVEDEGDGEEDDDGDDEDDDDDDELSPLSLFWTDVCVLCRIWLA